MPSNGHGAEDSIDCGRVSLGSADLLDVGCTVDLVAGFADGFHLDVFDGHNVDELLFGPDIVNTLRQRTTLPLGGRARTGRSVTTTTSRC